MAKSTTPGSVALVQPAAALDSVWSWGPAAWVLGVATALQQVVLWRAEIYNLFTLLSLLSIVFVAIVYLFCCRPTICPNGGHGPRRLPAGLRHPNAWQLAFALVAFVAVVAAGAASTGWRAALRQADVLWPQWHGVTLVLTGQVDDLPRAASSGWRFGFRVEGAQPLGASSGSTQGIPQRVQLNWTAQADGAMPQAGERWRLAVRLRQPHGLANPGGFDSELWLWEQGVGATGQVRLGKHDPPPQRLATADWGWDTWRERVRQHIQAQVASARVAGVVSALVMGDQAAIERRDWDVFRATGVAHLVSISGLHITLWAWLAMRLVGRLWRWLPRLAPRWGSRLLHACPAPWAAAWGGWLLALGYALFSGWGIPAQRTVLMLAVVMGLRLLGRRWPWPVVGVWAVAIVLAWDPWAWLQAGFWLSFVAVGVLMAVGDGPASAHAAPPDAGQRSPRLGRLGRVVWPMAAQLGHALRDLLRTQWAISLALAPLTLVLFGQVSVVGLLANLVAIPVVTWLITPLALAGVAWHPLWVPAAAAVQALMALLHTMSTWPGATATLPALPAWLAGAAVLGGLVLVWRLPLWLRAMGLALCLPAVLWQAPRPALGEFEVLAADVGQGSAVLVRTASGSVLYDAGPQWGHGSDAGQRVLLPWLQAIGETPQHVVLSHRDGDHVGGALAVLHALGTAPRRAASPLPPPLHWPTPLPLNVWASFEPSAMVSALSDPQLAQRVVASPPAWTRCQAGQRWTQDGVVFELLHPRPALYGLPTVSNNLSCVLWVRGQTRSALLTGDMDATHEAALVKAYPNLRADWLLAPHHGSRTASSAALLDAVQPTWVVAQAGYLSRYGHPAPEVLRRYQAKGIRWVATPACGAATWRSVQPSDITCQRQAAPKHWHWRPGSASVGQGGANEGDEQAPPPSPD